MTSLPVSVAEPQAGDGVAGAGAAASLDRSVRALQERQHDEGWWKGELETNVTMDAEDLLLRQFLGIRTEQQTASAATWIRSRQRDDGTWATYYGGPPDLSTTIEAYIALRLAGDAVDAPHMALASAFVRDAGGIGASRVFTRIWLALFGKWPWDSLPILPPELVLLPSWVPLNIYDFGCWARQTVVALTVVTAHRPVRDLSIDIGELDVGPVAPARHSLTTWAGRFDVLDKILHRYERRPIAALRRVSLGAAERWILKRQEADGSWGGIQPPWVYSLMALHLQGYALDHPVMEAGLAGLDGFTIEDEAGRRIEACQSPVWDTALAVAALADAGLAPDDPSLRPGRSMVVARGDHRPGRLDRAAATPLPGWVGVRVRQRQLPRHRRHGRGGDRPHPYNRARWWGGGSRYSLDRGHAMPGRWLGCLRRRQHTCPLPRASLLRFRRAHRSTQRRCHGARRRDVVAARAQRPGDRARCRLAPRGAGARRFVVRPLGGQSPLRHRRGRACSDRRWRPLRTRRGAKSRGLGPRPSKRRRGLGRGHALLRRCGAWSGHGTSNPSQTAWALLALLAADERGPATDRGVAFLVDSQLPDGTWDETWFTGTGFPGDFYINYHLYHLVFPVMALGRYVRGLDRGSDGGRDRD